MQICIQELLAALLVTLGCYACSADMGLDSL